MKKNTIKAAVCAVSLVLFLVLILCGIALVDRYAPAWLSAILFGVAVLYIFVDAFAFFDKELDKMENEEKEGEE